MATSSKINIKNIDYFKFKKLVVDGNRDDYVGCSREVRALCDSVQTLSFRDEEFDDASDRARFDDIITYYKQILSSKRIDPTDIRVKNGWWLDTNSFNVCSAGKFKRAALKETLIVKTREWLSRHGTTDLNPENVPDMLDGPGLYIFKHKERQCFQYVGKADKIFNSCAEKLKSAFDGTLNEPLGALIITSMAADWDFYFIPVQQGDGRDILRILENDVILKHDCIWPHGLNFSLHIDSLLEVSEFRKSCLRHHWPPETDTVDEPEVNLDRLRRLESNGETVRSENGISRDSADSNSSPSNPDPRLPSARQKTEENGRSTEDLQSTLINAGRQKKGSGGSTRLAPAPRQQPLPSRPSSAPKPLPPKQGDANRPKSPAFSKGDHAAAAAAAKRTDAQKQRSLDAKPTGAVRHPLERPKSSLDGRHQHLGTARHSERVAADGMTRSTSGSSVGDPRREKSLLESSVKEPSRASGIKAPAARRPQTAKLIRSADVSLQSTSNE